VRPTYSTLSVLALWLGLVLAACARTPATPTPQATPPPPTSPVSPCRLTPIVAPTLAPDPGYSQLDPTTGLHVTGHAPLLDLDTYRLRVTGNVSQPLALSYDELRCLPRVQASPVLTCPGYFVDHATWAGTPIAEVLALAGVPAEAAAVGVMAADGYATWLTLAQALDRSNFLAYEWEGQPLPRLHGFPLRVVMPGAEGNQWTKWVIEIEVK
jgi:DMSO/TMAO reductase YedYZ molybdopterin-dependent catalytic subunit